jgi:hypothetical protein
MPPYLIPSEQILYDGAIGRIVALTDTLDANGRFSIDYNGSTFRGKVLKATIDSVEYPLVTEHTGDRQLRVGLLRKRTSAGEWALPSEYALVVDDGPAPTGWGRNVGGDKTGWEEASEFAAEDSCVHTMGWAPGTITILKGGVIEAGVYVDLYMIYTTEGGQTAAWYLPASPHTNWDEADLGMLKTDGAGEVDMIRPDGERSPVILPRGMGAEFHRIGDSWPSAPTPERHLEAVYLYYQQESVELVEGLDVTLDIVGVTIDVTGPPSANVSSIWELGGVERPDTTSLDGGGAGSLTGIPPGVYLLQCYHPTDAGKYLPWQTVAATTSGETYTVDFGGSWTDQAALTYSGIAYAYDLVPAVGAGVYYLNVSNEWILGTTTDSSGAWELSGFPGIDVIIVAHATWGAVAMDPTDVDELWWEAQLSARFSAVQSASGPGNPEGVEWWGDNGNHVNMPAPQNFAYLICVETGERYDIGNATAGVISEPAPRWRFDPDADTGPISTWATLDTFNLYDADGSLITAGLSLSGDNAPPWASPTPFYETNNVGTRLSDTVGGKILGPTIDANQGEEVPDTLEVPYLEGLEFGKYEQEHEWRASYTEGEQSASALQFTASSCEYCGGPSWREPDRDGYYRGRCMACTDNDFAVDCRLFGKTRSLAAVSTWKITVAETRTDGIGLNVLVDGWPRPEEFDRTGPYIVTFNGLARHKATHIVLASWDGANGYVAGETIADAEARLDRTVGPVMLKVKMLAGMAAGCTLIVTATPVNGGSRDLEVTIPPGAATDDLFPLDWWAHHYYPRGYYTAVTNITGGAQELDCQIVNDGPAWQSTEGVVVKHEQLTPYACDIDFLGDDVDSVLDGSGIGWITYLRVGAVYARAVPNPRLPWSAEVQVSAAHVYRYPRIRALADGSLQITAFDRRTRQTVHWQSRARGDSWEFV